MCSLPETCQCITNNKKFNYNIYIFSYTLQFHSASFLDFGLTGFVFSAVVSLSFVLVGSILHFNFHNCCTYNCLLISLLGNFNTFNFCSGNLYMLHLCQYTCKDSGQPSTFIINFNLCVKYIQISLPNQPIIRIVQYPGSFF